MTFSCFVRDSNKRPFSKFKGGCLFEGGRLLDNFTFRVVAYSRVGAYSRGALIRSIYGRYCFLPFTMIGRFFNSVDNAL